MIRLPTSARSAPDLPPPVAAELARSDRVLEHVRALIQGEDGFIGFDRYMDAALYLPGAGYYVAGQTKFGEAGDFVTAPELGALFGSCLARQCDQVLGETGGDIIEFGAGTGALAAQILTGVTHLPERYLIVETSAELIARQRETLLQTCSDTARARVHWVSELPESLTGVVVANEVLDAMPVTRFMVDEASGRLLELGVGLEDGRLVNCVRTSGAAESIEQRFAELDLPSGYRSEFNPRAEAWCATVGRSLTRGVLLLIDYGYPFSEYYSVERASGTLRCHYRHRAHEDPLLWPGLQDITAHVDFSAVTQAGLDAGLELAGYASQANFLIGCGLVDFVAPHESCSERQRVALSQQVNQLTSPSAMGEAFKALAMARGFEQPLLGFSGRDQRHLLFRR